jgi:hypothetical protein
MQGVKVQGNPFDLVPDQEVVKGAIFEIGSIDPEVDQQLQALLEEAYHPSPLGSW